jgi:hypothetical protein
MDGGFWILVAGIGLVLGASGVGALYRASRIKKLAAKFGFDYLGRTDPPFVSLVDTPFSKATSFWNVIQGQQAGVRVVVFDCRIGSGRHSWRRTVIAAETSAEVFAGVRFNPELTIDRSGSWQLMHEPQLGTFAVRHLLPVREVEAYLAEIGR